MCYQEANKLNSSHTQKTFVTPGGGPGQTPPVAGGAGQKAACSQSKASITSKQTGAARLPVSPARVYYTHQSVPEPSSSFMLFAVLVQNILETHNTVNYGYDGWIFPQGL